MDYKSNILEIGSKIKLEDALTVDKVSNYVGIGTTEPSQALHISGNLRLTGAIYDSNNSAGTSGQVLSSTGTATDWVSLSEIQGVDGTGTANTVAMWTPDGDTLGNSHITQSAALANDIIIPQYVRHTSDTNTYFGFGLNDTINFGTSGSERMRIDSSGNVGIGTTNPTAPLDVNGIRAGRDWHITNRAGIRLDSNGTGYPSDLLFGHTAAANQTSWAGVYWSLSSRAATDDNKFHFYRGAGNPTGASESVLMTLDPNLRVGIGTTSPAKKLDVAGEIQGTNFFAETYRSARTDGDIYIQAATATDFVSIGTQVSPNLMRIDGGGNVGIGTPSPDKKFQVSDGTHTFSISPHSNGIDLHSTGNIAPHYQTNFTLYTGAIGSGSAKVTVDSSGNVGIGTTNPGYKLDVDGGAGVALRLNSTADAQLMLNSSDSWTGIGFNDGAASGTDYLWHNGVSQTFAFGGGGSNVSGKKLHVHGAMTIGASLASTAVPTNGLLVEGNVGIGTTSPRNKLQVEGNIEIGHWATAGSRYFGYSRLDTGAFGTAGASGIEIESGNFGGTGNYDQKVHIWTHTYNGGSGRRLTVDNYGNVGIGTTDPGNKLHIYSAASGFSGTYDSRYKSIIESNGEAYYVSYVPDNSFSGIRFNNSSGLRAYIDYYHGTQGEYMLYSAQNHHRFAIGVSEKMRITSTGYVGIGTTNPQYKLDVEGSANNADIGIRINNTFDDNNPASEPNAVLFFNAASNNGYLRVHGAPANTAAKHQIDLGSTAATSFLTFSPSGSEKMRITSGGNVGIGTATPDQKLMVMGSVGFGDGYNGGVYANIDSTNTDTNWGLEVQKTSGVSDYNTRLKYYPGTGESRKAGIYNSLTESYSLYSDSKNNPDIIIPNGNLGIGTTNPGVKFQVGDSGDTSNYVRVRTSTSDVYVGANPSSTHIGINNGGKILQTLAYPLAIGTTQNQELYLGANNAIIATLVDGKVGIGTTSPAQNFVVADATNGNGIELVPGATGTIQTYNRGTSTYTNLNIDTLETRLRSIGATVFNNGSGFSESMRIDSDGNVGIGETNPGEKLQVNSGNIKIEGGATSSIRGLIIAHTGQTGNQTLLVQNSTNSFGHLYTTERALRIEAGKDGGTGSGETLDFWVNGSERMMIDTSGNVGIGTPSPSYALDIERQTGEVAIQLQARDDSSNTAIYFGDNSDADVGSLIYNQGSNYMSFTTNAGERMRIDSNGDVGINETNPSQKLHVNGNARVTGFYYDSNNSEGTPGYVLSSTSGGTAWVTADSVISYKWYAVSDGGLASASISNSTSLDFQGGTGISTSTSGSGSAYTIEFTNTDRGSAQNIFKNVAGPTGQPTIVAASNNDTVTLKDDRFITITTNNSTKTAQFSPKVLDVCSFVTAFKSPSAQTNYLTWVPGSYQSSLDALTYKTALYDGEIDVVKIISDVTVSGVYIEVYETGAPTTPIWSSGSTSLTANTVTSFSPSGATFSANDQLYVTLSIPTSATVSYRIDFGLLYS